MAVVSGTSTNGYLSEHPKERIKDLNNQRKVHRYAGNPSPIPEQIRDQGEYKKFFSMYKDVFIPYAGADSYTSHSLLTFLLSLAEVSQTKCAVIEAKKMYALSGALRIQRLEDPDFDIERNTDVSESEKRQFIEFIKEIDFFGVDGRKISIKEFYNERLEAIESCGNFYILASKIDFQGAKKLEFRILPPDEVLYLAMDDNEVQMLGVSKYWTLEWLSKYEPDLYPRYPDFAVMEDGVDRCIIHEKTSGGRWYGRPKDLGSMGYQYLEYQNQDMLNKDTENAFMGKVLLEFEAADNEGVINDEDSQDNGFLNFADELMENFSNQGQKPVSIMVTERPHGAKEAFVHEFRGNTNEKWYTEINDTCETQILKSHNWPRKLIGLVESTGLSTNAFKEVFQIASATVIKKLQDDANASFNVLLKLATEFFERDELNDFSLVFTSPFQEMIEQEAEAEEEAEQNNQDNGSNANADNG